MSKKILMVTANNANNYGAALQAYALLRKLSDFGPVTTLNYDNKHISTSMDYIRVKPSIHGFLGTAKDICRLKPRISAIKKFRRFAEQNLNLSPHMSKAALSEHPILDYDVFISGSDQIWNPNCVNAKGHIDGTYFLDFAPDGKKKISYASSWGGFHPTPSEQDVIHKLLSSYSHISVRENDTRDFLKKMLKRDVHHSLDPTLLLQADEWQEVLSEKILSRVPAKYILMYSVPKLPLVIQMVKYISKTMGLPVVVLDQDPFVAIRKCTHIKDAGPEEFLTLFKNATFVVTDSFHGTCFSLSFEVPFAVTTHGVHSNRISSLLQLTGLENRLIDGTTNFVDIELDVDFSEATKNLQSARSRDLHYLSASLTE